MTQTHFHRTLASVILLLFLDNFFWLLDHERCSFKENYYYNAEVTVAERVIFFFAFYVYCKQNGAGSFL